MIDSEKLNKRIEESGLKKKLIAKTLCITPYTLSLKINNVSEFKVSEVYKLIELLHLNQNEVFYIFFKNY